MTQLRGRSTRRTFLGVLGTGVVSTAGCLGSATSDELSIGVIPDVDPDTAIDKNTPLANHLEDELGVTISLDTTSDYAGLVQATTGDHVDIAYFGGVSYVIASQRADVRAIAVGEKDGSTKWESVFVAHESSGIEDPTDLRDASDVDFVFGDPISTSGTVMPTYYANEEWDIDLEADLSTTHVGAHDAVVRTVANGDADAGSLNARIFDAKHEAGKTDGAIEIWRTPSFADYPWAVGPSVDDDRAEEIQQAFLTLHESVSDEMLDQLNVDRYVEADHDDFADIEAAVELMGITDV
ncbi:phosphate/phosphite/phosphonate ABC transporter substrate-binding protein [Natrinema halophilum]|uniref:phosphate/phosphite/phosphonate ABC transporter substrate-binding protein n=1 Tax=Natrinema halophilum TaxID=1699371 RepID=UPI001F434E37|nr:phosphate/phosphite/phosphonate ABC transporter substrate-binding protein [Natrinema halophilum]UHQ96172.1 phosphate/phosphite/phosphonate ABC transporter substrate-binding protein [Natrinema halophilum]